MLAASPVAENHPRGLMVRRFVIAVALLVSCGDDDDDGLPIECTGEACNCNETACVCAEDCTVHCKVECTVTCEDRAKCTAEGGDVAVT